MLESNSLKKTIKTTAGKPTAKSATKPTAKPTASKSTAKPTTKPIAPKSTAKPTTKPTASKSTTKPTVPEQDDDHIKEFTDDTYKLLNSKVRVHVFNPTEVQAETKKNIYIVPNNQRRTSQVISEFEFTRVLGERSQQIQNGSQIFVEPDLNSTEIDIARLEIKMGCCPLTIIRMYNSNIGELWSVNELEKNEE